MTLERPVIFGEILFDYFPDGSSVCSGAPLNVCRNLKYLGYEPLMISRVGVDELGDQAIAHLSAIDLDLSGVQRDAAHPTSCATVKIEENEPSYHFTPDSAWDFIDAISAVTSCADFDPAFIYTGTLALRSKPTAAALDAILKQCRVPLFFDANLRDPWWHPDMVQALLKRATWLKCNQEEYTTLFDSAAPQTIRAEHQLTALIITRGADGAGIYTADGQVEASPPALDGPLIDTVGAGDAFASAVIDGLLRQHPLPEILTAALALSAKVCQQRGADWG